MENEIWKPVKGYEEYYHVSNMGRVKSLAKEWVTGERFGIRKKEESFLKFGYNKGGYLNVTFCVDKRKESVSVSRLVAFHFVENPNNYPVVNHINSIRNDNRAENLEWCTTQQNVVHGFEFGFREGRKGEKHHNTKLKTEDVIKIRELYDLGTISQKEIGRLYGINQVQIGRIIRKERWKHI